MSSGMAKLFGRLCVEQGYIDQAQLEEALKVQQALGFKGRPLALGTVLRTLGYLTAGEMDEILKMQKPEEQIDLHRREDALFAELVIENGFATRAQVKEALKSQVASKSPLKLVQILLERRLITQEQRAAVIRAMTRIVHDIKAGAFVEAPKPEEPLPRKRTRPFSGLFLFDPSSAQAGENEDEDDTDFLEEQDLLEDDEP
ncbi:MAG: hypothetical protein HY720_01205 [Planctomycetes bacterium]|nr:hypothetical protein [Planctomycetota bacterium]